LCEAVSTIPASATPPSRSRISAETAGVAMRPSTPTQQRATPFASAMRRMVWAASTQKKRPSPPTTSVQPRSRASPSVSKKACTRFST
jgi:hypothetical protein